MQDNITRLGNYRLVRLLGQGGFAEVYLGEHIHLKTNVDHDGTPGPGYDRSLGTGLAACNCWYLLRCS